jgi:acetyl esterase/lipase
MSRQQQLQLDEMLRQGGLDTETDDVPALRAAFSALTAQVPIAADVQQQTTTVGGVACIDVTIEGTEPTGVLLYFHGGVYVVGSAATSIPLVSDLVRRSGLRAITLDYRLGPEHPYPAAVDDARAAYEGLLAAGYHPGQIVLAGDSAGGGLAVATLVSIREAGLAQPAGALLMSPYADLTLSGETLTLKEPLDTILKPAGLRARVADYVGGANAGDPHISPVFADLHDLPPLLIQVGSNEVLLSDALRLASRAAIDDVPVTLEVTPGVPHVFQSFAAVLDEAGAALDRAAAFVDAQLQ